MPQSRAYGGGEYTKNTQAGFGERRPLSSLCCFACFGWSPPMQGLEVEQVVGDKGNKITDAGHSRTRDRV